MNDILGKEYLRGGLGTCPPLLGSTRQFEVLLAYKSKSGSNIVPTGLLLLLSTIFSLSWQVPLPLDDMLQCQMNHELVDVT